MKCDMGWRVSIFNRPTLLVAPSPCSWGISASNYAWLGPNFIEDRAAIASAAGKPIILEEYGMRPGYLPSRDTLLNYLQDEANAAGMCVRCPCCARPPGPRLTGTPPCATSLLPMPA
jgi:hypothetical protein